MIQPPKLCERLDLSMKELIAEREELNALEKSEDWTYHVRDKIARRQHCILGLMASHAVKFETLKNETITEKLWRLIKWNQ